MNEPIRILLVDDQPDFTEVLAKRLVRRGMVVDEAEDGNEALGMLQSARYDVAVFDLRMPGADGVQLLKAARLRFPAMAVILLTGHGSVHDAMRASEAGAFEFLSKPVSLEALEETIRRAVRVRGARA
ncbi:MAG: response regulator [Pseudodesulfovibrio sp.]